DRPGGSQLPQLFRARLTGPGAQLGQQRNQFGHRGGGGGVGQLSARLVAHHAHHSDRGGDPVWCRLFPDGSRVRVVGGGTPATVLLSRQRVWHRLHTYDVPATAPDYGRAVADALGVPPQRLFKTLVTVVDGALTVAVVAVDGELDFKALAAAVGGKRAALADQAVAERADRKSTRLNSSHVK